MFRLLLALLLIPLVFSYEISEYTGGDVNVDDHIVLELPVPRGEECIPILYLLVEGNYDSPVVKVGNETVRGKGSYRFLLRGEKVVLEASGSGRILGSSRVECSKDPLVFVDHYAPVPVVIGSYNYYDVAIKNAGYSEANVRLYIEFPKVVAPWNPLENRYTVPPRSQLNISMFLLTGPFFDKPFAFPMVCVEYSDSFSETRKCAQGIPSYPVVKPLVKCVNDVCYNVSSLIVDGSLPGDVVNPRKDHYSVVKYATEKYHPDGDYKYSVTAWSVLPLVALVLALAVAERKGFI